MGQLEARHTCLRLAGGCGDGVTGPCLSSSSKPVYAYSLGSSTEFQEKTQKFPRCLEALAWDWHDVISTAFHWPRPSHKASPDLGDWEGKTPTSSNEDLKSHIAKGADTGLYEELGTFL